MKTQHYTTWSVVTALGRCSQVATLKMGKGRGKERPLSFQWYLQGGSVQVPGPADTSESRERTLCLQDEACPVAVSTGPARPTVTIPVALI